MQKMVLDEVYELLRQIGAVASESEFSTEWLVRSECYMRTLRFKHANPSVGTLAICASRLQHYASCVRFSISPYTNALRPRYSSAFSCSSGWVLFICNAVDFRLRFSSKQTRPCVVMSLRVDL